MSFAYRPATSFTERKGVFVALTGGTNAGKSFSALRLARGIAGPKGKVAVLDTEGGRTLHLKADFDFDANIMDPPYAPGRFAEAAKGAEDAGYDALLIDSFSMEWAGIGGVLNWQENELQRMAGDDYAKRERMKMAAWIKPKVAHKQMVLSFLNRRIPIIFSIRGEESVKPVENGGKPIKIFKSVCNKEFPFEMTVAFRLAADRKGYLDLSDPLTWKMEGAHQEIFRDGERLSEDHGARLAAWARGDGVAATPPRLPGWPLLVGPDDLIEVEPGQWMAEFEKIIAIVPAHALPTFLRDMRPHLASIAETSDDGADAARQAAQTVETKISAKVAA